MAKILHVFSGTFESREEACQYSEQQWEEPAPDDSWSKEEYAAWEARNPIWLLRSDLAPARLDPDFIETIFGTDMLDYLKSQLASEADWQKLRAEISDSANTLVLIFSACFDGGNVRLSSTPQLRYHGEYVWESS